LAEFYPDQAREAQVEGQAAVKCSVTADAHLDDCLIVSEDPPGFGFGRATLQAARSMNLRAKAAAGKPPVGGQVIVPINWRSAGNIGVQEPKLADTTKQGPTLSWRRKPSDADLAAIYPVKALRKRVGGTVVMRCTSGAAGDLTKCALVSETPAGYGLGAATLAAARRLQLDPVDRTGRSVAGAAILTSVVWAVR
jgi:TonB family protein